MPPATPLHLAIALDGAGWHPAAWREPQARPAELFTVGVQAYEAGPLRGLLGLSRPASRYATA